jgi:hypothetical protein
MSDMNDAGGRRLVVLAIGESRRGDGKSSWTRIGHAFENRDGSTTLYLNAFPIGTDKIQVREEREDERPAAPRKAAPKLEEVRP